MLGGLNVKVEFAPTNIEWTLPVDPFDVLFHALGLGGLVLVALGAVVVQGAPVVEVLLASFMAFC